MTLAEAAQSHQRRLVLNKPSNFELCRQCKGELILSELKGDTTELVDKN